MQTLPRSVNSVMVNNYTETQLRKALAWMNRAPYTSRVDHIRAVIVRRLQALANEASLYDIRHTVI